MGGGVAGQNDRTGQGYPVFPSSKSSEPGQPDSAAFLCATLSAYTHDISPSQPAPQHWQLRVPPVCSDAALPTTVAMTALSRCHKPSTMPRKMPIWQAQPHWLDGVALRPL